MLKRFIRHILGCGHCDYRLKHELAKQATAEAQKIVDGLADLVRAAFRDKRGM